MLFLLEMYNVPMCFVQFLTRLISATNQICGIVASHVNHFLSQASCKSPTVPGVAKSPDCGSEETTMSIPWLAC